MPRASEALSFRRYNQIKRYLHYCDDSVAILDREHPEYDKLHKVRMLIDYLKAKFIALYCPHEEVSVDECMIPYVGRWSGKCYDSSKPIKWGIKVWMACDAKSGYAFNLDVYCGTDKDFVDLNSVNKSAAVVLKLVQSLWDKGYHIFTDRYYTSPNLLHWLRRLNLSGTGTCMTNRRGFPKSIVVSKGEGRKLKQGDFKWVQCQTTGIVATRWTDKKPIYFLSNAVVPETNDPITVTRVTKTGEKIQVAATPSVCVYNRCMGGVDLNDKMAKLDKSRKSYKWYSRIDRKCVHWSLYNAYVLYRESNPNPKPMEFRDFTLHLLTALVSDVSYRRTTPKRSSSASSEVRFARDTLHCPTWPSDGSKDHRCVVCEKKYAIEREANPHTPYKDMVHKSVKTSVFCDTCNVYLCIKKGSTCWKDFHNKVEFWR